MTDTPVEAYVITPEQLRARDERIIRASADYFDWISGGLGADLIDAIIAQADEVDQ